MRKCISLKAHFSEEYLNILCFNWQELSTYTGFPRWCSGKNLPANTGDIRGTYSILGSGRPLGIRNGNPLQHSCMKNSMDTGPCQAIVQESQRVDPVYTCSSENVKSCSKLPLARVVWIHDWCLANPSSLSLRCGCLIRVLHMLTKAPRV